MNIKEDLSTKFLFREDFHGYSILKHSFPQEHKELYQLLHTFSITENDITTPGGRKSPISDKFDQSLYNLGWSEKQFKVEIGIDGQQQPCPTHKIDYFKNRIGIELEWNNKDPFFDRDLNNFRLLHSIKALSVGIIVTRDSSLQEIFDKLGKGSSYGASTTHWNKLIPKVNGGGGGSCPLVLIGIKPSCVIK